MKKHKLNHEKTPKGILSSLVLRLGVFAVIIVCIAMIISNESTLAEKQQELAEIQAKKAMLQAENVRLSRELESDEYSYMENYALNYLNYAYPNERRFYDTSRN